MNSKSKIILLFVITSLMMTSCSRSLSYKVYDNDENIGNFESLIIVDEMILDNNYHIFSARDPKQNPSIHFYVADANKKIIYKSGSQGDSDSYDLTVFKATKKNKYIILGHISNEYSWGCDVHYLDGSSIKNIGFVNAAQYRKNDQPWNVSPCVGIEALNANDFNMRFSCDKIIFDPGGPEEKKLNGSSIFYAYRGNKLELILNHSR